MTKTDKNHLALSTGVGCGALAVLGTVFIPLALFFALNLFYSYYTSNRNVSFAQPGGAEYVPVTDVSLPVLPDTGGSNESALLRPGQPLIQENAGSMAALYQKLNPGVVNILVYGKEGGLVIEKIGSGFILDDKGYIVTNYHVVAGAEQIGVTFYNGQKVEAEIIGFDDASDLAVIKVEELAEGTYPLSLGDSDQTIVGDWVIAIGNPFGQPGSMSVGIVSGVNRTIPTPVPDFVIPGAIQTDAAINPGSSGGPLFNLQGEVIGLNTQIVAVSLTTPSGVGFAIPINLVRQVVPTLIENRTYEWSWLGVQGGKVNPILMEANSLVSEQGAYVDVVIPGSPAEQAGLKGSLKTELIDDMLVPVGGDVVVAVNDQPIANLNDLLVYVAGKEPDDEIELTILRDGQPQQVMVTLKPRPLNYYVVP